MSTDALTWLREVEKAMTPGEWVDGAGYIFAAADLEDGMVRKGECEVASCYGGNRQADEAGILALRNLFPSALAVVEATARVGRLGCDQMPPDVHLTADEWAREECHDCPSCRLNAALDDFTAAVREEQERHAHD